MFDNVSSQVGLVVLAYLFGSLPFGYWIAKLAKINWNRVLSNDVCSETFFARIKLFPMRIRATIAKLKKEDWSYDIRNDGSYNTGYSNVKRIFGKWWGRAVLALDVAKSFVPTFIAWKYGSTELAGLCAYSAALGHSKSLYFFIHDKDWVFSGGKSVATMLGGLIVLDWKLALASLGMYLVVKKLTKYVSVGSMAGCMVPFIYSEVAGLDTFWKWLYFALMVLIIYNHRRNIACLIQGTESKDGETVAEDNGTVIPVVFVVHPITLADYSQTPLSAWIPWLARVLSPKGESEWARKVAAFIENIMARIAALGAVIENAKITGIKTAEGQKVKVLIFSVPLLPWQIKDKGYERRLDRRLKSAVVLATRRGARYVGFGALLSSAAKGGGKDHQIWAKRRGLRIIIDNGAANTAAAVVTLLRRVSPRPLEEMTVAMVGASGAIGWIVTKYLETEGKVKSLIAIARENLAKLEGLDSKVEKALCLEPIAGANIVVLATSAKDPIINADTVHLLKRSAVVADVGVPANFDATVMATRPDLRDTFFRCGLVRLPGENVQCGMDFHMGHSVENGKRIQLYPACLAQIVILGITGKSEFASRGLRVTPEAIDFFAEQSKLLGFEVITSAVAERTLFSAEEGEQNN